MKRSRQKAILTLLSQRRITTQKQLCDALLEQGFRVTQATLSRDIAELGLTKSSQIFYVRNGFLDIKQCAVILVYTGKSLTYFIKR